MFYKPPNSSSIPPIPMKKQGNNPTRSDRHPQAYDTKQHFENKSAQPKLEMNVQICSEAPFSIVHILYQERIPLRIPNFSSIMISQPPASKSFVPSITRKKRLYSLPRESLQSIHCILWTLLYSFNSFLYHFSANDSRRAFYLLTLKMKKEDFVT